jgi:hypothetical protein
MTQEDIIEMARQVGVKKATAPSGTVGDYFWGTPHQLTAFAKLVAAKERELSAKELDEISKEAKNLAPNGYVWKTIKECAEVIRARSGGES